MPPGPGAARGSSKPTRRQFLAAGCGLILTGALAGPASVAYALKVEPGWLAVTVRDVPVPRLPASLDGLSIAHLSDIHYGPYVSVKQVAEAVDLANSLQPDLVALTGDFVHREAPAIDACAQELARLKPRVATLAVLGNHDVWTDPDGITESLRGAGAQVLRDEQLILEGDGGRLWLLGIDDRGYSGFRGGSPQAFFSRWSGATRRVTALLEGIPAEDSRLLLVHNPDFTEALPAGGVDLALCGHTHGGQVRLPLIGAPVVPSVFGQRYAAGLVQGGRTLVHVTRGVGVTPPAVRLNCRPEVALLRLRVAV